MSEHREDLEGRLASAAAAERLWTELMEHPGWKKLLEIMDEQQRLRKESVCLTPITSVGEAFSQEFYKGEFGGIGLVLATPRTQLEIAQTERRVLTQELEIEDETEHDVAAADAGRLDGSPFGSYTSGDDDGSGSGNS